MKSSIVSVLRISTHSLYTCTRNRSFLFGTYSTTGVFLNLAKNIITVCIRLMALCPHQFNSNRHGLQRICDNNHTKVGSNKVVTPVYRLTVSPPAASRQYQRQEQVINETRFWHMWRLFVNSSGCFSERKNSFQCQSIVQGYIQKSQDNAHNTQVACSSRVSR